MAVILPSQIVRNARLAQQAFTVLNNAAEGFDPTFEIDAWALVRRAETTDDVSVYTTTDDQGDEWVILVGTDGMGSDDSRWAVRVGDTGVEVE